MKAVPWANELLVRSLPTCIFLRLLASLFIATKLISVLLCTASALIMPTTLVTWQSEPRTSEHRLHTQSPRPYKEATTILWARHCKPRQTTWNIMLVRQLCLALYRKNRQSGSIFEKSTELPIILVPEKVSWSPNVCVFLKFVTWTYTTVQNRKVIWLAEKSENVGRAEYPRFSALRRQINDAAVRSTFSLLRSLA